MNSLFRFAIAIYAAFAATNVLAFSGAYDVGGGASVPLPQGNWLLLHKSRNTAYGQSGEVIVLGAESPESSTRLVVINHTARNERWRSDAQCFKNPGNAHTELYGSTRSALVVKCSRSWVDTGSFASWVKRRNHKYWTEALPGLQQAKIKANYIQTEIELRNFNGRNVNVHLFTQVPKSFGGQPVNYFYFGMKTELSAWYLSWIEAYTESLQAAFQFRQPAPRIVALGFNGSPGEVVVAKADALKEKSLDMLLESAREGDPNRANLAEAPPVTLPTAPSDQEKGAVTNIDAAQSTTPRAAQASVDDVSKLDSTDRERKRLQVPQDDQGLAAQQLAAREAIEKQRQAVEAQAQKQLAAQQQLEQERLALAKQKDSIAAELAAMRQMLAELKKANEDSARAEKQAAAEPAIKEPAKPVVMARRRALVIGNDNYKNVSKLENAVEDAKAMSEALEGLGYKVDLHANLTERAFKRALRTFRADLKGGEEVLFFYAGHGVQLGNSNYLLPIDLGSDSADQVRDESIELQRVLDDIAEQKTKFALAVIDACRDNPFKQTGRAIGGRGLAPTTAATGQMVMFSAGAGQQALDKLGQTDSSPNGLFTRVFLDEMKKPGIPVDKVLRNVRQRVVTLAKSVGHEQVPALYDQAIGEFYFKPK
jgi:hypothetical protein